MEFKEVLDGYMAVGAGGLSVIILVWLLIYLVTKIKPALDTIQESNLVHSEVLKNSTEAVREVSRSNDNVANALVLLNHSFSTLTTLFEKHDNNQVEMARAMMEMKCNVSAITELVLVAKRKEMAEDAASNDDPN